MLDGQWPDGLMQSEHVSKLKIGVGLFYRATPVLFFMREKSRSSEKWKNMKKWIWPIAFFDVPKIETFWRKTTVDATTIRSGSERLSPEKFRWEHVSLSGNHVSFSGNRLSFRQIRVSSSGNQVSFSGNRVSSNENQLSFRWIQVSSSGKQVSLKWTHETFRRDQICDHSKIRIRTKNTYQKHAMGQMKNHNFCKIKKRLRVKFQNLDRGRTIKSPTPNPRPP